MGKTKKTDKLDAGGLAILLRNGTLPEVWIPPADLRDQRELLRLRMFLSALRTQVKNRNTARWGAITSRSRSPICSESKAGFDWVSD
jgi:transposase